jgi:tRNA modification GTPase
MHDDATIFALSSGRPPAAIGVVRISGPRAGEALRALTGRIPEPRMATFARVCDPESREPIDEALALWFPAPRSETGEDVAELQLHGGRAVIAATLAALSKIEGLRPAEAGEFTRRAFENGKLDLTAVEALADLVMAETQGQRRQALRQMQGALRLSAESWREQLVRALALIEARIDFADEADVPENLVEPALATARALAQEIETALRDDRRGERLREGMVVAIAGPPNAGKSTLLNRIARRDAAIVSPYAGTTRDVIEVHLDLAGWPVTLLDTAGIRESEDPIEREGVRRARERAAAADVVLWVVDAREPAWRDETGVGGLPVERPLWIVHNKIDLLEAADRNESMLSSIENCESGRATYETLISMVNKGLAPSHESKFTGAELEFNVSASTGTGIESLLTALAQRAEYFLGGSEPALVTRERHRRLLEEASAALRRALAPTLVQREDLLAEELRLAARALERLIGRVDVEDVLDVIFRDFCIGK